MSGTVSEILSAPIETYSSYEKGSAGERGVIHSELVVVNYTLDFFSRPTNSDVVCTKENKYLSKCTITCLPGYILKGYNSTSCTGKGDGSDVGKWTRKWPECRGKI